MPSQAQTLITSLQLGALLQGTRKSLKLTQAQLAARLGLSQRRVSELERAPGTLSVDQFLAMCAQLGLQITVRSSDTAAHDPKDHASEW